MAGCCGGRKLFPLVTQILCLTLGLIAFIMSAVTCSGCSFVTPLSGVDDDGDVKRCYPQAGLFNYRTPSMVNGVCVYSQCINYPSGYLASLDGASKSIKPAQAMGAVAAAFGGLVWAGCIFMLFFRFPAWLFKTIGGLYLFCFVTQMLTLLMLNDPACNGPGADLLKLADDGYKCGLGSDAITAIIAGIFYLGLGITVLVCPVPKTAIITCIDCAGCCENGCGDDEEGGCGCCGEEGASGAVETTTKAQRRQINSGQEPAVNNSTVTEQYNKDGTITVTEERINPDGSKTVSVTTRPNPSAVSASV